MSDSLSSCRGEPPTGKVGSLRGVTRGSERPLSSHVAVSVLLVIRLRIRVSMIFIQGPQPGTVVHHPPVSLRTTGPFRCKQFCDLVTKLERKGGVCTLYEWVCGTDVSG